MDQGCQEPAYKQERQEQLMIVNCEDNGLIKQQKYQLVDQRMSGQSRASNADIFNMSGQEYQAYLRVENQLIQRSTYQPEYQDLRYHQSPDKECQESTDQKECQEPANQGLRNQQDQLKYPQTQDQGYQELADKQDYHLSQNQVCQEPANKGLKNQQTFQPGDQRSTYQLDYQDLKYNQSQNQEGQESTDKCQEPVYQELGNQQDQLGYHKLAYQPECQDQKYQQSQSDSRQIDKIQPISGTNQDQEDCSRQINKTPPPSGTDKHGKTWRNSRLDNKQPVLGRGRPPEESSRSANNQRTSRHVGK